MKAENGATYGEFVVLRALKAKGGEAPFSELSRIELQGIERLLVRMLPARSRPGESAAAPEKRIPGRRKMNGDVRPALISRRFASAAVHYRLTPAGQRGADFHGPWTRRVGNRTVEWSPDLVEVFEIPERTAERMLVGSFSPERIFVDKVGIWRANPARADWKIFRNLMKLHHELRIPHEAMPDRLRWPSGFAL